MTASYGDRILSFEHRSLSETLLRSASDLLRCLAPDMTLDVLSLSRGGMFIELLVHGPVSPATVRGLAARSRGLPGFDETRFVDAFIEFSRLWRMKRPKIRRLLRAGCAIAGIPLLQSGRTRFYGLLFASARLARGRRAPLPTLLKSLWLVLTQAESGDQPMGLPGMDDQRGDSPVLRLLADAGQNRPPFDSDLAGLAGDFEGGGPVARAIQRQAARLHGLPSEGDHDIVVPVARMVGGLRRTQALLFKVRGPGAHHFAYLSDDATRDAALHWLTRPKGSPGPPCFAGLQGAFLDPFAPTGPTR